MFFALLEDISPILTIVEKTTDLKYYRSGLADNNDVINYMTMFDIPNIGFTTSGDWNRIDSYLILKKTTPLIIRDVPQRRGGVKFAVDQLLNPKSIEFKLGGIYKDLSNVIVASRVATASEDQDSLELFKLFSLKIKKEFKKFGAFYVGKNAEEKLKLGWRLVTNEKLPKEHDLTFP